MAPVFEHGVDAVPQASPRLFWPHPRKQDRIGGGVQHAPSNCSRASSAPHGPHPPLPRPAMNLPAPRRRVAESAHQARWRAPLQAPSGTSRRQRVPTLPGGPHSTARLSQQLGRTASSRRPTALAGPAARLHPRLTTGTTRTQPCPRRRRNGTMSAPPA